MDYDKLIAFRDRENPFAVFLGIQTTKIAEGYAEVVLPLKPEYLNPTKAVHGGCLYTIGDIAAGAVAASYGTKAVTVSGEYHYLTAAKDTKKIRARARCIKSGRTLLTIDVELSDDADRLIGKGIFTYFRLLNEVISLD